MEFVVLLLLVNLVVSSFLIYQFSQLGKRFRGEDDGMDWQNHATETILRTVDATRNDLFKTQSEVHKVHKIVNETSHYAFLNNRGLRYLDAAVGSEFDKCAVEEMMREAWTNYAERNFD